jgi:hypothetical protein
MATKDKQQLTKIKPGSPEMESLLSAGYPDIATREHAKEILATREKNPALIPWDVAQRATAFLEALDATAKVINPEPGRLDSRNA